KFGSERHLMLWFDRTRFSASSGSMLLRPRLAPVLGLLALAAATLAPAVFAACEQNTSAAVYVTSWDSYGIMNIVRLAEGRAPDTVAGKGPYPDRYSYGNPAAPLRLSYNVLAFQIPQLNTNLASAELRLQIRYLVSFRGS